MLIKLALIKDGDKTLTAVYDTALKDLVVFDAKTGRAVELRTKQSTYKSAAHALEALRVSYGRDIQQELFAV